MNPPWTTSLLGGYADFSLPPPPPPPGLNRQGLLDSSVSSDATGSVSATTYQGEAVPYNNMTQKPIRTNPCPAVSQEKGKIPSLLQQIVSGVPPQYPSEHSDLSAGRPPKPLFPVGAEPLSRPQPLMNVNPYQYYQRRPYDNYNQHNYYQQPDFSGYYKNDVVLNNRQPLICDSDSDVLGGSNEDNKDDISYYGDSTEMSSLQHFVSSEVPPESMPAETPSQLSTLQQMAANMPARQGFRKPGPTQGYFGGVPPRRPQM